VRGRCSGGFAAVALLVVRERRIRPWLTTGGLFAALLLWGAVDGLAWKQSVHPISLSMTIALLLAFAALLSRGLPERRSLAALGTFGGLIATRTAVSTHVSGPYAGVAHFASALTWVVFLCVVVPRVFSMSARGRLILRRLLAVAVLIVGWYGAFAGVRSLSEEWKEEVDTRHGKIFVDSRLAPFFRAISREIAPGERVWVLPEVNAVDVLFRTENASPYPSQMPGWLDEAHETKLVGAMNRRPPDAVVLFDRETREYGVPRFGVGFDRDLAEWIAENYVPVVTLRSGTVYRRRSAANKR
jgi:hypothetical protein